MGNMSDGIFCTKCRCLVPFSIKKRQRERIVNGQTFQYIERYGECQKCQHEISVPGLLDDNEKRFDIIYRRLTGIITVDEIGEILKKYDIEKRPLSHLLGFGEHTISRYLEGYFPNKNYSDLLLSILNDHTEMEKWLEKGKDRITPVAYRKVAKKLELIKKLTKCDTKIELIALYIANSDYDITDLSLQKLLYFVKAFSIGVFGNKSIFDGKCEAWAYGPVFPDIYAKYKSFGNSLLPHIELRQDYFAELSEDDRFIIDYVLGIFGRLNGKVLMDITHKESPWNMARLGLESFEMSNNVISDESISEYYQSMDKAYDLKTKDGVNKYINSLFEW